MASGARCSDSVLATSAANHHALKDKPITLGGEQVNG
jgi:hypothetical protein